MKLIIPGLYTFTGLTIGHVYLITEGDGLTIIDASVSGSAAKIADQLAAAGYQPSDVKRILITHAHTDHVGGLPGLVELTGAPVITSAIEKPYISDSVPQLKADPAQVPWFQKPFLLMPATVNKPTPVARTLQDGETLSEVFGGLQVIGTPGHSPGHISFWQPERRVIILGDVLFNAPRMMLPVAAFTTNVAENIRSLKKVVAMNPDTVCFGHGDPIVGGAGERIRAFAAKFN